MNTMNNAWRSTLGRKTGAIRETYQDPWPEPVTRQDYWGDVDEQYDLYENVEKPPSQQRRRRKERELDLPRKSDRTPGHLYNHVDRSQNMVAFFSKPNKW